MLKLVMIKVDLTKYQWSDKITVYCDHCDNEMIRTKSILKRAASKGHSHHFCNNSCQGAFRRALAKKAILDKGAKTCSICYNEKSLVEFNKNKSTPDGFNKVCRECGKIKSREYYQNNTENHRRTVYERTRRKREENARYIYNLLKNSSCVDCGEDNPIVLEFDHREPSKKSFGISEGMIRGYSIKRLKSEIKKCDVVCANCHRIRTAVQFGWSILRFIEEDSGVTQSGQST